MLHPVNDKEKTRSDEHNQGCKKNNNIRSKTALETHPVDADRVETEEGEHALVHDLGVDAQPPRGILVGVGLQHTHRLELLGCLRSERDEIQNYLVLKLEMAVNTGGKF